MTDLRKTVALFAFVFLALVSQGALAEDSKDPFEGVEMEPVKGTFIVTKSAVNLREKPGTNGAKLSKLDKDEVVRVVGQAKGTSWFAVVRESGERGFSYNPVFLRILDGRLSSPLKGRVTVQDGPNCRYELRNANEIDQDDTADLKVSDYWADMICNVNGRKISFTAFMFMTETPWNMNPGGSHQISMELADVAVEYDKVISAVTMWRYDKKTVVFDSVSPKKFKSAKPLQSKEASDVPSALKSAMEVALSAWNNKLWETVAKKEDVGEEAAPEEGEEGRAEKENSDTEEKAAEKPLPGMEHSGHGEE